MNRSTQLRRARALLVLPLAVAAVALSACAPPPGPTPNPNTPWLAAGCIDSDLPGVPDFGFNGIANELENAVSYETSPGVASEDGTCTGTEALPGTIVRAASSAAAVDVCAGLGLTVTDPARLVDFGYDAPIDAWTCLDPPPPAA